MIDQKIINRALVGPSEISDIYRAIDSKLLYRAMVPEYKPILRTIEDYYSRHKIPPSYNVLKKLLSDGFDLSIIDDIESDICSANEIGYYIDSIKRRYNKFLINYI